MKKPLNTILVGAILLCPAFPGYAQQAAPKGITPRESAARYAAQVELEGVAVGATLLTRDEVRQAFATDLSHCCVVIEVGLYPEMGKNATIARDDFTLRVAGADVPVKSSDPKLLALNLQLATRAQGDTTPHGSVGVSLGTGGYDPMTGRPLGRAVNASAGVGVGVGASGTPPTDKDRDFMESELTARTLPEGSVSRPVAGYLYFVLPTKKKKAAVRQLEYTQAGHKVVLTLR